MSIEPCFLTATEASKLIRSDKLTVEELAKSYLNRINERDEDVKAWVFLDPDLVLANARALDKVPKAERGPMHGIPIGVKDVIHTLDMPTTHGSVIYKDDFPKIDAGPIMTLRAAGALIFGKTTTTEFAASTVGPPTKNPFDSKRTPGGSSTGSGACIGDYQCALALGTQTVGSTLRPGSYNNCYAMKPTWTSISREGLKLLSISLDTIGLYGRSADDLDLFCEIFQLKDDEPVVPKPITEMRIAVCKTPVWDDAIVEESMKKVWVEAQEALKAAGATLVELELPKDFEKVLPATYRTMHSEARTAFLGDYLKTPDLFRDEHKSRVENRQGTSRKQQCADYDLLGAMRPIFDNIAAEYDAILAPTVPGEAWLGQAKTGDARHCGMWTGLHNPSINVPGFAGEHGMPIGLTLTSGRYTDRKLCMVAKGVGKVFKESKSGKGMNKLPGVPAGL